MEVIEIHQAPLWIQAHKSPWLHIPNFQTIQNQTPAGAHGSPEPLGEKGVDSLAQLPIWQEETLRHLPPPPPPRAAATHSLSHTQLTGLSNCLRWVPIPGTLNLVSVLL